MNKILKSFILTFIITGALFAFGYAIIVADTNTNSTLTGESATVFWTNSTDNGMTISILGKEMHIPEQIIDSFNSGYQGTCRFITYMNPNTFILMPIAANTIFKVISKAMSYTYDFGYWIAQKLG